MTNQVYYFKIVIIIAMDKDYQTTSTTQTDKSI